jgi:tRNA A37 threonylcarbamoyladenosine synthetase subunit TsaC/SUA5/YrdC
MLAGDELPANDGQELRERLQHEVDLVLDAGHCGTVPTTVLDLTGASPTVIRQGKGSLERLESQD